MTAINPTNLGARPHQDIAGTLLARELPDTIETQRLS